MANTTQQQIFGCCLTEIYSLKVKLCHGLRELIWYIVYVITPDIQMRWRREWMKPDELLRTVLSPRDLKEPTYLLTRVGQCRFRGLLTESATLCLRHCEPLKAVWLRSPITEPCICCKQVAEKPSGEHPKMYIYMYQYGYKAKSGSYSSSNIDPNILFMRVDEFHMLVNTILVTLVQLSHSALQQLVWQTLPIVRVTVLASNDVKLSYNKLLTNNCD